MSVQVLSPGVLTTVQDLGRAGHASIGVGTAGAMDPVALRLANALVGNPDGAAALEMTLHGPRLRFDIDTLIAISGGEIQVRCDDIVIPTWRPVCLRAGSELVFGHMRRGARAYLAIAGGIALAPVLGSRSSDVNAAIGPCPRALVGGDVVPTTHAPRELCADLWRILDTNARGNAAFGTWSIEPAAWFDNGADKPIHAIAGTHFEQLDSASQRALFGANFRIGIDSNRVGFRLDGMPLALREPIELVSSATAVGTVQLPPGGVPIALTCEAPTTGGYPRIAQIITVDQSRLAQRRPGDTVRLAQTDLRDAQMRYRQREHALTRLRATIQQRLMHPY